MIRKRLTDVGKPDANVASGGLTPRRTTSSPYFRIAAVLILIPAMAAGLWRAFYYETSDSGLVALTSAYRHARPTEARISGFDYAPLLAHRGGADKVDYAVRDRAERLLLDAVVQKSAPASHHALGKFYLAQGSLDKAIDQFQQALKEDSNNSQLRSDLGVVLFESSQVRQGKNESDRTLELLAQSFEQINEALRIDAGNREALFNRALILPYMKLREQGVAAWQAYLSLEAETDWINEAKHNLQLLQDSSKRATAEEMLDGFLSAFADRDHERAWKLLSENKEMITRKFIPQELAWAYLNQDPANQQRTAQLLYALRFAGELELERAKDPFVSELADYYAGTSTSQRATLRQAHTTLLAAYSSSLQPDYKAALPAFEKARVLFLQARDEWEARICDYWIAYCASQLTKLHQSTASLLSLAEYCERKNYSWLFSQVTCWLANNYTELGQHSDSIESYNRALSIAESTNDNYIQQKILSQLGNEYNLMGQSARALEYHWRSLQLVNSRYTSHRQLWRNFLYVARALIAMKMYRAAEAYGTGMLNLAKNDIKEPGFVHFSNIYLAQIYGGEHNFDAAIQLAQESLKIARSLSDEKLIAGSLRLIANLQRMAGRLNEALSAYDQAIQSYDQMEVSLYNYEVHKGRLLCYAALNDTQRFEAELPYVLNQYEQYREKIREEQNRNTFFDREQSVYDLAINHAYQQGRSELALDYSEKSRARSLLNSLTNHNHTNAPSTTQPANEGGVSLNVPEIQASLPAKVQLVEYAVLSDRIVFWVIKRDFYKSFTKDISSDYLQERVSRYVTAVVAGPGAAENVDAISRELYELVIAPVAPYLDAEKVLCIVPDKSLSYLPFAALVSPNSGQYLISEYALVSSPSLKVFLLSTETARRIGNQKPETLLSVGNPAFDPKDYPELHNLPEAATEAEQIAELYHDAPVLVGRHALKGSLKKLLPDANVFHFAGHYIMNERYPLLSRLVLAKSNGNAAPSADEDFMTGDLVEMRLPRTHLVVLSACQTGGEKYYNGEGLIGISRAFLEKGIPLVVGSQWAVESESTGELMLKFHRYRKTGLSSVEALRRSQVEMLSEANGPYRHPYYWAAFFAVGGYADF